MRVVVAFRLKCLELSPNLHPQISKSSRILINTLKKGRNYLDKRSDYGDDYEKPGFGFTAFVAGRGSAALPRDCQLGKEG